MSETPDPENIPDDENVSGGPVADKGAVGRPEFGGDRPETGGDAPPGPAPEAIEQLKEPGETPLNFESGAIDTAAVTQGDSVVDAEYGDRGPASHLSEHNPDALAERPLDADERVAYSDEEE